MGSLYIANVSRQRQIVCYRLDINKQGEVDDRMKMRAALSQTIESGTQTRVGGDLHPNQIAQIVDQLLTYGLVGVTDVPNNLNGVVSLIFNIEAPIPRNVMMAVLQHNSGVKIEEGAKRRERAAIAANEALKNQVDVPPREFDVEFEQEEVSELDEDRIEKGFHVVESPGGKPPSGSRKAKAA